MPIFKVTIPKRVYYVEAVNDSDAVSEAVEADLTMVPLDDYTVKVEEVEDYEGPIDNHNIKPAERKLNSYNQSPYSRQDIN